VPVTAPATVELMPALARRHSTRAFDPRPVDAAHTRALIEAARWAPSAMNRQPWRFVVGHRGDPTYQGLLAALHPGNREWAQHAGLLVATFARVGSPEEPEATADLTAAYELGLATAALEAQAWWSGLVSHQMGGFDAAAVRTAFGVPAEWRPVTVLAVGHPGDPDRLSEPLAARETAPRQRLSVAELTPRWAGADDATPEGEDYAA
jgi:nitroreductase